MNVRVDEKTMDCLDEANHTLTVSFSEDIEEAEQVEVWKEVMALVDHLHPKAWLIDFSKVLDSHWMDQDVRLADWPVRCAMADRADLNRSAILLSKVHFDKLAFNAADTKDSAIGYFVDAHSAMKWLSAA